MQADDSAEGEREAEKVEITLEDGSLLMIVGALHDAVLNGVIGVGTVRAVWVLVGVEFVGDFVVNGVTNSESVHGALDVSGCFKGGEDGAHVWGEAVGRAVDTFEKFGFVAVGEVVGVEDLALAREI